MSNRTIFAEKSLKVIREICALIDHGSMLEVIKAPPGSGKTYLLTQAVGHAITKALRLAVAAQTNSQADDLCQRLHRTYPGIQVMRFVGSSGQDPNLPAGVGIVRRWGDLPTSPCVVVGTSAKWGAAGDGTPLDLLFIDEAWQLSWSDFMLLHRVAARFILIGDPGQIPPVISVPTNRWETAKVPPHLAAPSVILANRTGVVEFPPMCTT